MRPKLESISLTINDNAVVGIRQRDPSLDAPCMLCVHGWLDNANSFVPMMPHLPSFDLVAIDMPGHGYSDHLNLSYTMHEMVYQLIRVIQELNWSHCHLVGHSLGGSVAMMLAVALPEAVQSLTLIDSSGPLSESASQFPDRMRRSIKDRLAVKPTQARVFAHKKEAVAARLNATTMAYSSAKLIIDRQVIQTEDGYQWRFDPRWRHASSQYQTEEQVKALLSALDCPVMTVLADQGYLADRPATADRLSCLKDHHSVNISGHHHLHMDTPEPVAAAINQFLGATPALGG